MKNFQDLIRDESGAGVVEYVVLSAVGVAAAFVIGNAVDGAVSAGADAISLAPNVSAPSLPNFSN